MEGKGRRQARSSIIVVQNIVEVDRLASVIINIHPQDHVSKKDTRL